MNLLTTATTTDEADRAATVAILPVGSFEQHGHRLPLITDTIVACAIAHTVAQTYDVLQLPPVTISCSYEHAGWPGTVSIRARTLSLMIEDIVESLSRSGVDKLIIVNGHGGNHVLDNIVLEHNTQQPQMSLFPARRDWERARSAARLDSSMHEDMHAGEIETSILLHAYPEIVRRGGPDPDHIADDRPYLTTLGMRGYTDSGVIGRPSLGAASKGSAVLDSLVTSFSTHLKMVGS